jgi:hypothetical protein
MISIGKPPPFQVAGFGKKALARAHFRKKTVDGASFAGTGVPPELFTTVVAHRYFVAPLLVDLEFCRIRFWYPVARGSDISRGDQSHLLLESHIDRCCCCDFQK